MRILAASDIHGSHETYHWIAALSNHGNVEALVLAGDLLGYAEGFDSIEAAQQADAAIISDILGAVDIPIYYLMGNDDEVDLEPPHDRSFLLHGRRIDTPAFNFVGYQSTLPFMGGVNERPEEVIAADLLNLESLMDDRTVFVTHSPALGILDATLLGPAGSLSVRDTITRRNVRAHIHGHTHGSFGRQGRHFNVAAGHKKRAMIIDVESMAHEVLEIS